MNLKFLPWHKKIALDFLENLQNKFIHSWFIYGHEGIGKFHFALSISASILCNSPNNLLACEICQSCLLIKSGNHPDLKIILPDILSMDNLYNKDNYISYNSHYVNKKLSKEIRIEQIHNLKEWFYRFTYINNKPKIVIIYPGKCLNTVSSNAILKILEDFNLKLIFLIVSEYTDDVIPTILSRCSRLLLKSPSYDESKKWLIDNNINNIDDHIYINGNSPLHIMLYGDDYKLYQDFLDIIINALILGYISENKVFYLFDKLGTLECISILQKLYFDLIQVSYGLKIQFFIKRYKEIIKIKNKYSINSFVYMWNLLYREKKIFSTHYLNNKLLIINILKNMKKLYFTD
ncbi:DNA polymerase III subunit delta' [Candidatus Kinetoplastibacterium sorsogonicusi]|uniref:DNA polymerase III subunit delta n=1 Tax=Candidatus Kinetoplastidibacterium kentomonadis TaxID=1576550 RepID=A0A3Q8ERB5_9PROT|nr:hypothetical protein [Candidatus Kinetoplastibacterium sorsogonicusi]AWD32443.1 DNA polymerase III subunit delta' [Candidatus Kinetoplastibacterium sorsogonicusi]